VNGKINFATIVLQGKVSLLLLVWELGDLEAALKLAVEKKIPVPP
jgi:hypothetical protein